MNTTKEQSAWQAEALEVDLLREKLAQVTAQRDELLSALKDIADFGRSYGLTAENAVDGIRNKAQAAIAKGNTQ